MIRVISAVEANTFAIGKNNDLIYYIPEDLKYFKKVTSGKKVLMGLNTFRSLPNGALPNRLNIILVPELPNIDDSVKESNILYVTEKNIIFVTSIDDALWVAKNIQPELDTYVIGGGMVYKQFIQYADELLLTEITPDDNKFTEDADTFFPKDEVLANFEKVDSILGSEKYTDKTGRTFTYSFNTYKRKS